MCGKVILFVCYFYFKICIKLKCVFLNNGVNLGFWFSVNISKGYFDIGIVSEWCMLYVDFSMIFI